MASSIIGVAGAFAFDQTFLSGLETSPHTKSIISHCAQLDDKKMGRPLKFKALGEWEKLSPQIYMVAFAHEDNFYAPEHIGVPKGFYFGGMEGEVPEGYGICTY